MRRRVRGPCRCGSRAGPGAVRRPARAALRASFGTAQLEQRAAEAEQRVVVGRRALDDAPRTRPAPPRTGASGSRRARAPRGSRSCPARGRAPWPAGRSRVEVAGLEQRGPALEQVVQRQPWASSVRRGPGARRRGGSAHHARSRPRSPPPRASSARRPRRWARVGSPAAAAVALLAQGAHVAAAAGERAKRVLERLQGRAGPGVRRVRRSARSSSGSGARRAAAAAAAEGERTPPASSSAASSAAERDQAPTACRSVGAPRRRAGRARRRRRGRGASPSGRRPRASSPGERGGAADGVGSNVTQPMLGEPRLDPRVGVEVAHDVLLGLAVAASRT